ncbi:hypothetical protein [Streptomyces anandii]|nr:hypothetical protein [Streptomyces anandii]
MPGPAAVQQSVQVRGGVLDWLDPSGEVAGDLSEGAGPTMRQEPHQVTQ